MRLNLPTPRSGHPPATLASSAKGQLPTYRGHFQDFVFDFESRLLSYNGRLSSLSTEIDAAQRKVWGANNLKGSVSLRQYNCGPTCMGCPHPTWYVLRLRTNARIGSPAYGRHFIAPVKTANPSRFSHVYRAPLVRDLVNEALRLIARRNLFFAHTRKLRQHISVVDVAAGG